MPINRLVLEININQSFKFDWVSIFMDYYWLSSIEIDFEYMNLSLHVI